jgi:Domain of unknown function (DUF4157)
MSKHQFDRVAPQRQQQDSEPLREGATSTPDASHAGHALMQLQRTHGNRHVQRVVNEVREAAQPAPVIQPKLALGAPNDKYEREADRVAQQVTQPWAGSRDPAGTATDVPSIQLLSVAPGAAASAGVGQVDAGMQQAIQGARGGGQPLPALVRAPMEQALGADFSDVRVHTGAQADALNQSLQARAFTTGRDIFFRRGGFEPGSQNGQALLAHELTHVVQQDGSASPLIQRQLVSINNSTTHFKDDKTGIEAIRIGTDPNVYVGIHDGQDYIIETTTSGETTFVLQTPNTPFVISNAPITWGITGTAPLQTSTQTAPQTAPKTTAQATAAIVAAQAAVAKGAAKYKIQSAASIPDYWTSPRGQTKYSLTPTTRRLYRQGPPGGKNARKTRREASGMVNPSHSHTNMLPLWEAAALSPKPAKGVTKKWLMSPNRRFSVVHSPRRTSRTTITGHSQGVLGHDTSAGSHFNLDRHMHVIKDNRAYNRQMNLYHGIEESRYSASSGHYDPAYESPRPDRSSHPTYYDPSSTGYTGGPWHSYAPQTDQDVIDYLDGKLSGFQTSTDPLELQAYEELVNLKGTYNWGLAEKLLSVIKQQGW